MLEPAGVMLLASVSEGTGRPSSMTKEMIEVYEVEDGESRSQYPFTGIPADVVPSVGDILLLPLSLVNATQEGKLPMDSAAYRVVDITRLYLEHPLRHRKVWVHVRRMMEAEYDRTPV